MLKYLSTYLPIYLSRSTWLLSWGNGAIPSRWLHLGSQWRRQGGPIRSPTASFCLHSLSTRRNNDFYPDPFPLGHKLLRNRSPYSSSFVKQNAGVSLSISGSHFFVPTLTYVEPKVGGRVSMGGPTSEVWGHWFARLYSRLFTADFRMAGQKANGKWRDVIANGNTVQ